MRMSEEEKRQRRQERKAKEERSRLVHEACEDERARMNQAVHAGKVVIVKAIGDRYVLDSVTPDWWYRTYPEGSRPDGWNLRSWAGCNDGDWAGMMEQAGLERNPLFVPEGEKRPEEPRQIEAWEVPGILARGMQYRYSHKYPEDEALLANPTIVPHLKNITKIADNDKYWRWADEALRAYHPEVWAAMRKQAYAAQLPRRS